MTSIGEKIAVQRLIKRWTQKRLASSVGITQSMLSQYENNRISPRWDIIVAIAAKLEVPLARLLPIEDELS